MGLVALWSLGNKVLILRELILCHCYFTRDILRYAVKLNDALKMSKISAVNDIDLDLF